MPYPGVMDAAPVPAARTGGWTSLSRLQRVALIGLGVLIGLGLAVWIATIVLRPHLPTAAETIGQARARSELSGGAQVFATHCAYCHAHRIGPALAGLGLDAAAIKGFVRSGPGPMPAFTPSQVSDADIVAVTTYITALPATPAGKD